MCIYIYIYIYIYIHTCNNNSHIRPYNKHTRPQDGPMHMYIIHICYYYVCHLNLTSFAIRNNIT